MRFFNIAMSYMWATAQVCGTVDFKVGYGLAILKGMNGRQDMDSMNIAMEDRIVARQEQTLRELASDLAAMVETGELSELEANEWLAAKADAYFGGDR